MSVLVIMHSTLKIKQLLFFPFILFIIIIQYHKLFFQLFVLQLSYASSVYLILNAKITALANNLYVISSKNKEILRN
jgi:hypothetical protein